MSDLIFAVRSFVSSNLGWFHATRSTLGEAAGRERAININSEVFELWYPGIDGSVTKEVSLQCRYFTGDATGYPSKQIIDNRTIRNQGGGKNWRLAGDAIEGDFYGSIRLGDLMLMMFDRKRKILSWLCIRGEDNSAGRVVPAEELAVYSEIKRLLGRENASRSMWLPSNDVTAQILDNVRKIYSESGELLMELQYLCESFSEHLSSRGLVFKKQLIERFIASLLAKPFLILTGLAGSGKTKLAQAFASWICNCEDDYLLVPVGPDWNSRDCVLGYADALDPGNYCRTSILDLILRADKNREKPHFIILDEMNLSHVERYFADLLSVIESGEPIYLHSDPEERNGVPDKLRLPNNVFVIGTVNVDETTYMFSPKVLDRANVIEFRVTRDALDEFLSGSISVGSSSRGVGAFSETFLNEAKSTDFDFTEEEEKYLYAELTLYFDALVEGWAEFGFRSAKEMLRFAHFHKKAVGLGWSPNLAIDSQVLQKMLPKLHGSRRKLESLLCTMAALSYKRREWSGSNSDDVRKEAIDFARTWADPRSKDHPLKVDEATRQPAYPHSQAYYPLSFEKSVRMLILLDRNGFASFAEA